MFGTVAKFFISILRQSFYKGEGMKKVGLVCCSDGLAVEKTDEIGRLKTVLAELGIVSVESPYLYRKDSNAGNLFESRGNIASGTPKERAEALMRMYRNTEIDAVFDVSGGNLANQILPWLDFEIIKNSKKELWGYSDLTVLLNAVYTKTGNKGWLYQPRMLVGRAGEEQVSRFASMIAGTGAGKIQQTSYYPDDWKFLRGEHIEGTLVGGNIRCFLKLAGTEYFPDLEEKVLILESLGGGYGVIASLLAQLQQIGAFEKVQGVILGTFTELDQQEGVEAVEQLVMEASGDIQVPVVRTMQIGHSSSSKALQIGNYIEINKK